MLGLTGQPEQLNWKASGSVKHSVSRTIGWRKTPSANFWLPCGCTHQCTHTSVKRTYIKMHIIYHAIDVVCSKQTDFTHWRQIFPSQTSTRTQKQAPPRRAKAKLRRSEGNMDPSARRVCFQFCFRFQFSSPHHHFFEKYQINTGGIKRSLY